jgi:hypothetical protein
MCIYIWEQVYERAVAIAPEETATLYNYAVFLEEKRADAPAAAGRLSYSLARFLSLSISLSRARAFSTYLYIYIYMHAYIVREAYMYICMLRMDNTKRGVYTHIITRP